MTAWRPIGQAFLRRLFQRYTGGSMPPFNAGGRLPASHGRYILLGRCLLDGYALVRSLDPPYSGGGPEHVIPSEEIPTYATALARIAEAHGFEVAAEAEQIAREAGGG